MKFPQSILAFAIAGIALRACFAADAPPQVMSDPLSDTRAYTLFLNEEGVPVRGYFPMGFVHGLPQQALEAGFNTRQCISRGGEIFAGKPFTPPNVPIFPQRLRYYSLAWAAESLAVSPLYGPAKPGKEEPPTRAIGADGKPLSKNRAKLNLYDPATQRHLLDYVREHVRTWAVPIPGMVSGPMIDCWGLDNEWEGTPDYSKEARAAFAQWLQASYHNDLAGLAEAWRRNEPSFESAAQGPLPSPEDYRSNPGLFLDWWTFQSRHFSGLLAEMARAMHDTDPLRRGVVHKSTQLTIEMPGVNREHTFDHETFAELMRPVCGGYYGIDIYGAGDRQAYEVNYIAQCIQPLDRRPGYGVRLCETNNHGGPGHAFASTMWRLLPNGLKAVDFFTLGFAGAKNDWDKFGFLEPATGKPKDKLFYAARWAHMVHRTEAFWNECAPAEGLPRVAMLMPRRDVLLSDLSDRKASRYAYPRNHRWLVYRWLREQGYWVDVVPYAKIDPGYMKAYDAVLLVGAEHLTGEEAQTLRAYVGNGGTLVGDARPGYFDEHHRARNPLEELFGVALASYNEHGETRVDFQGTQLNAHGVLASAVCAAKAVSWSPDGKPVVFVNRFGKGKALYLGLELGSAVPQKTGDAMESFLKDGPTADSEEYATTATEGMVAAWLAGLLQTVGVHPAYRSLAPAQTARQLRVEQPAADRQGNCALVLTNRADMDQKILEAQEIELPLPEGLWERAWWSPAEDDSLTPVKIRALGGNRYRLSAPQIASAGVIYLFRSGPPLLGIQPIESELRSVDGHGAKVSPGKPFKVVAQLCNPSAQTLERGTLRALVPAGWQVVPAQIQTAPVKSGAMETYMFEVTPEADSARLKPDWLHPVVIRWNDGLRDAAIGSTNVEAAPQAAQIPRLLSGNASYPETYPYRVETGAAYCWLNDGGAVSDPAQKGNGKNGPALTNGFDSKIGLRSSPVSSGAYFARAQSETASVLFDLKSAYEVMRVNVTPGPGGPAPASFKVLASRDGETFRTVDAVSLHGSRGEYSTPLFHASARFIRIEAAWPGPGGTLDEIEIWGKVISPGNHP